MSVLATLPLAFSGFALIGLSMDRHARQAGRTVAWGRARPGGWALLALSLIAAVTSANWRFGLVEWIGVAAVAAGFVVLALLYWPRFLMGAAFIATPLGLIGWLVS